MVKGKSVTQRMPDTFCIATCTGVDGGTISLTGTVKTTDELCAVIEVLGVVGQWIEPHRQALTNHSDLTEGEK